MTTSVWNGPTTRRNQIPINRRPCTVLSRPRITRKIQMTDSHGHCSGGFKVLLQRTFLFQQTNGLCTCKKGRLKVKEVDLYSAFIVVPHAQGAQVRITQCYLQITPYLLLPRKHSLDGASPDWGCGHLIAAYYSFIYPKRMKGWVGLVGWPTADRLPT